MTNAVIVSTARTPLAKSWKGAFNMTHGATLGGHAVQHAVARAGIENAHAALQPVAGAQQAVLHHRARRHVVQLAFRHRHIHKGVTAMNHLRQLGPGDDFAAIGKKLAPQQTLHGRVDPNTVKIIQAVLALARALHMPVTAIGGMANGRLVKDTSVRTTSGCCQPPSSQNTAPCKEALDRPSHWGHAGFRPSMRPLAGSTSTSPASAWASMSWSGSWNGVSFMGRACAR